MSIAVSAVVYPSRILYALVVAMAAMTACIALAIAAGHLGELGSHTRFSTSTVLFFLAFFGFYHGTRNRKTIQLDISGSGQIRLSGTLQEAPCADVNRPHVREIGEVVQLLDNSTIWPNMLLLRLRSDDGRITVVPVLPDSISRDGFRALSVACRWISVQKEPQDEKIF